MQCRTVPTPPQLLTRKFLATNQEKGGKKKIKMENVEEN